MKNQARRYTDTLGIVSAQSPQAAASSNRFAAGSAAGA
jgi:hypothetical protein